VKEHYHNKQTTALANGTVIWDGGYPKMALASSFPTSLNPFPKLKDHSIQYKNIKKKLEKY
jgi:hypothetical protein